MSLCEKLLSDILAAQNDHRAALKHYKNYIRTRDSIFNKENTKKTVQSEMNYEFEKRKAQQEADTKKKEAIAMADAKRQKIILYSVATLGAMILIFAVFAYRSFLQKKKVNVAIMRQKQLIEEKQKEILDSIHYARRIQRALITNEKYVHKTLVRLRAVDNSQKRQEL